MARAVVGSAAAASFVVLFSCVRVPVCGARCGALRRSGGVAFAVLSVRTARVRFGLGCVRFPAPVHAVFLSSALELVRAFFLTATRSARCARIFLPSVLLLRFLGLMSGIGVMLSGFCGGTVRIFVRRLLVLAVGWVWGGCGGEGRE